MTHDKGTLAKTLRREYANSGINGFSSLDEVMVNSKITEYLTKPGILSRHIILAKCFSFLRPQNSQFACNCDTFHRFSFGVIGQLPH